MDEKEIIDWVRLSKNCVFNDKNNNSDSGTITMRKPIKAGSGFTWFVYPVTESNDFLIFMGELECTPEEIQEYYDEIESIKMSNKFNI